MSCRGRGTQLAETCHPLLTKTSSSVLRGSLRFQEGSASSATHCAAVASTGICSGCGCIGHSACWAHKGLPASLRHVGVSTGRQAAAGRAQAHQPHQRVLFSVQNYRITASKGHTSLLVVCSCGKVMCRSGFLLALYVGHPFPTFAVR